MDGEDPVQQAIGRYFGGDAQLYEAYVDMCRVQFVQDILDGDAASANQDWQAMRRTAHNLKSVLLTLGHAQACQLARGLEDQAGAGAEHEVRLSWACLRQIVAGIAQR